MLITLFAGSRLPTDRRLIDDTRRFATACARRNHTLVFGGSDRGLMGIAAHAALNEGGSVIGIHCDLLREIEPPMTGLTSLESLPTLAARRERLISIADLVVTLPGGVGTLDELFEAIALRSLGLLRARLVLLNLHGFFDPLIAQLGQQEALGFIPASSGWLTILDRPEDVLLDAAG